MTTKAEMIARLRVKLDDADAGSWSDAELSIYLDEAAIEYSRIFPRVRTVQFTPNGFDHVYELPPDTIESDVSNVWLILPNQTRYEVDGNITRLRRPERSWEAVNKQLIFNFVIPATYTVEMRYFALCDIPEIGDATVPLEDESFIYQWAGYLAWRKIGAADASLSRWTEGKKRDDSPVIPEYVHWEREWYKMVQRKQARGSFTTRRRGQRYGRDYYYTGQ